MMILRSLLFIPGDSEKKLSKGDASGADALILDLEDSVTLENKTAARELVSAYLDKRPRTKRKSHLWVRINPLDTKHALDDLSAVVEADPDGIMLPKADGPDDVRKLSHYLDALEASAGLTRSVTKIIPVATETARAPFSLGDYADAGLDRLVGLTWGAEDLSAALGASTNLGPDGIWAFTYQQVRSMTLLAAHAADVQAIDTLYADFKDEKGLSASCGEARREGFSGRLAIHPAQIAAINENFMPSANEVSFARRVVDSFAKNPGAGAIGMDGKMLDLPHLKQAERTLALHKSFAS